LVNFLKILIFLKEIYIYVFFFFFFFFFLNHSKFLKNYLLIDIILYLFIDRFYMLYKNNKYNNIDINKNSFFFFFRINLNHIYLFIYLFNYLLLIF